MAVAALIESLNTSVPSVVILCVFSYYMEVNCMTNGNDWSRPFMFVVFEKSEIGN